MTPAGPQASALARYPSTHHDVTRAAEASALRSPDRGEFLANRSITAAELIDAIEDEIGDGEQSAPVFAVCVAIEAIFGTSGIIIGQ